jgi:peptidoglycan hydrolase-like protein with peptidoglycan-binding domain
VTAAARGWGPGWPNCQWSSFVTLVRADGLRLPVRRELAELTTLLLDLTELSGYDVLPGQTWGVACRAISGTSTPSNHSWGLADDLNAPANPYASADWHRRNARGTRPFGLAIVCDIPQAVVELWEGHGYRWGGRYRTKPDPMHFEFMGTPADAAAITQRLRVFLAGHGQPAPPPPQHKPSPNPPTDITKERIMGLPVLRRGATGQHVRNLQGLLVAHGNDLAVDGDFGPTTEAVLQGWQARTGKLAADGIAGSNTWAWLIGI